MLNLKKTNKKFHLGVQLEQKYLKNMVRSRAVLQEKRILLAAFSFSYLKISCLDSKPIELGELSTAFPSLFLRDLLRSPSIGAFK